MEGLDQHNTVVRIEPGATYPWRPLDGDTAAVWVPEGSGGRWVAVPQAHVRPGHHAHLRSFTPDGSLPPPPPPGVDISGSFGTRILGADSSSQLLLEAWDPQRPDDAVRLIGNLEPGTYLTGEPVGNRIPVYDHTRRLWGWVIRGGA